MILQSKILKKSLLELLSGSKGSCDILTSDGEPSCTKLDQIKQIKVKMSADVSPKLGQKVFEDCSAPAKVIMSVSTPLKTSGNLPALHSMVFPS